MAMMLNEDAIPKWTVTLTVNDIERLVQEALDDQGARVYYDCTHNTLCVVDKDRRTHTVILEVRAIARPTPRQCSKSDDCVLGDGHAGDCDEVPF